MASSSSVFFQFSMKSFLMNFVQPEGNVRGHVVRGHQGPDEPLQGEWCHDVMMS